jgi:hypothetical protein
MAHLGSGRDGLHFLRIACPSHAPPWVPQVLEQDTKALEALKAMFGQPPELPDGTARKSTSALRHHHGPAFLSVARCPLLSSALLTTRPAPLGTGCSEGRRFAFRM